MVASADMAMPCQKVMKTTLFELWRRTRQEVFRQMKIMSKGVRTVVLSRYFVDNIARLIESTKLTP